LWFLNFNPPLLKFLKKDWPSSRAPTPERGVPNAALPGWEQNLILILLTSLLALA
jgi:hypothetical protein